MSGEACNRLRLMRRPWLPLVLLVTLLGAFLRFWELSSVPPALYCDEAFQGYEAFSLLSTGADSRGVRLPLFFSIFGVGWQEPLYIYLTTLSISILGTTAGAARAVAAAAGTLAVPAVAWLAFRLRGGPAALSAALLIAFSPWALQFSRIGFQASLLPLLLGAGAAALLQGAEGRLDRPRSEGRGPGRGASFPLLILGVVLMASSLYAYVATRLLVPLLLAGFAVAFLPALRRLGVARLALLVLLMALLAAPIAAFSLTEEGRARMQDVGLTARYGGEAAAGRFISNYLSYWGPGFLLTEGDPNPRHSVQGYGMMHVPGLLLLVAGVAAALVRRRPADLFLLWWLAIAPLPGALAADPAHAVRAIGILPALYALAGGGAAALFGPGGVFHPGRLLGRAALALIVLVALLSWSLYLHAYFVVYPVHSAPAWQYGLRQAYEAAEARSGEHDVIYVTRLEDFPWIHRLYLFAFPPSEYQEKGWEGTGYLFDEPVFYGRGVIPGRESPLFILKPEEVPGEGLRGRQVVTYPDGAPAFVIAW